MGRRGKEEFDHANYGIFAGAEGLANINTMDVEQTPDAYVMTRTCEGCGELKQCMIDWAEIYCLQYGIMPAEVGRAIRRPDLFDTPWVYSAQHMVYHPNFHDTCDGHPLVIFNMTPVEAERVLSAAGKNGVISEEQQNLIRAISPVVRRMADAKRGVPAQQVQQQYVQAAQQQRMSGPPPGYPNGVPMQGRRGGGGFFGR